ncbi:glycosyltransferase family 52 [Streptococcus merionis]|uniref:Capsular polysaccharide biosynthesis protein CpsK(V) n=1 Tax=Streptococcus merionis TaxID=400065 RepID=A0A239SMV2_9STRE|nr:glycosyltransferase family 52 [Streptococcus merionis]SNU86188.1 Capsular polysaccharide biosynthesis protein CpsK(V) [Streptococcus merionis]
MKKYICFTNMQVMISLMKKQKGESIALFLHFNVRGHQELAERIKAFFPDIWVEILTGKIIQTKQYFDWLEEEDHVYLFNDADQVGQEFRDRKYPYHLIEDGLNFHYHYAQLAGLSDVDSSLEHYGFNPACLDIEVNDISKIKDNSFYARFLDKFIEVPRRELFERQEETHLKKLFALYQVEDINLISPSYLILTQPLADDFWSTFKKEDKSPDYAKQYYFYFKMAQEAKEAGYHVYLKPHPRDDLDYHGIPEVTILPRYTPMEMIDLRLSTSFDVAATLMSSSIEGITKVKEKRVIYTEQLTNSQNRP